MSTVKCLIKCQMSNVKGLIECQMSNIKWQKSTGQFVKKQMSNFKQCQTMSNNVKQC